MVDRLNFNKGEWQLIHVNWWVRSLTLVHIRLVPAL
jgi:hypothetical protein